MSKDTETTRHDAEIAQFRFALIAPVVQGLFPDASATAYYKRVTASPLTLPDGSTVTYSYKTLEKWKSLYNTGGLDALMPNVRSDKPSCHGLISKAAPAAFQTRLRQSAVNPRRVCGKCRYGTIGEVFLPKSKCGLHLPQCAV